MWMWFGLEKAGDAFKAAVADSLQNVRPGSPGEHGSNLSLKHAQAEMLAPKHFFPIFKL